nr:PREDICTED: uncharacterized protein LOC107079130 [Lepisosteus oculatus]
MPSSAERTDRQSLLWTEADRMRIKERFQASLAGLMELELLKSQHQEMVEAALGISGALHSRSPEPESEAVWWQQQSARPHSKTDGSYRYQLLEGGSSLKLTRSLSQDVLGGPETPGWQPLQSSLSSEHLLELSAEGGAALRGDLGRQLDSKSRASSGFCDDDGSLSNSCASLCSEASSGSEWWEEGRFGRRDLTLKQRSVPLRGRGREGKGRDTPADSWVPSSPRDLSPISGFLSIADLCPQSYWQAVSSILQPQMVLERRYRLDLVSHKTKEAYYYPSPLHAVALQSPLYSPPQSSQASMQQSPTDQLNEESSRHSSLGSADLQPNATTCCTPSSEFCSPPASASDSRYSSQLPIPFSEQRRLEKFISKLVTRWHPCSEASRLIASVSELQQLRSSSLSSVACQNSCGEGASLSSGSSYSICGVQTLRMKKRRHSAFAYVNDDSRQSGLFISDVPRKRADLEEGTRLDGSAGHWNPNSGCKAELRGSKHLCRSEGQNVLDSPCSCRDLCVVDVPFLRHGTDFPEISRRSGSSCYPSQPKRSMNRFGCAFTSDSLPPSLGSGQLNLEADGLHSASQSAFSPRPEEIRAVTGSQPHLGHRAL